MIYDTLPVALLTSLAVERQGSTNGHIARYLLAHVDELNDLSVKGLASACSVGTGSISRFCREVGFESFGALRQALLDSRRSFQRTSDASSFRERADEHARQLSDGLLRVARSVDERMLAALVDDLCTYERVSTYGLLKAQAAAIDLQVDLLMLGKVVDTCTSYAEQLDRIASAGRDELIVIFSYTGSYFDEHDLSDALRRIDRPRIWMVCGSRRQLPAYVTGCLAFESDGSQLGHPYQLELVAGLIAQEYARRCEAASV